MNERQNSNESAIARDIVDAFRARVESTRELDQQMADDRLAIDRMHKQQLESFALSGRSDVEQLQGEYDSVKAQAAADYASQREHIQGRFNAELARIQKVYDTGIASANKQYDEAEWMLESVHDSATDENPEARYDAFVSKTRTTREYLETHWQQLETLFRSMTDVLQRRRHPVPVAEERELEPIHGAGDCVTNLEECVQDVELELARLKSQWLGALLVGSRPIQLALIVFFISWGAMSAFRADLQLAISDPSNADWTWIGLAAGCAIGFTLVFELILLMVARWRASRVSDRIMERLQFARWSMTEWKRLTNAKQQKMKADSDKWKRQVAHERKTTMSRALSVRDAKIKKLSDDREQKMGNAQDEFPGMLVDLELEHEQRIKAMDAEYPARIADCQQQSDSEREAIESTYHSQLAEWTQKREAALEQVNGDWNAVATHCRQLLQQRTEAIQPAHESWSRLGEESCELTEELPAGVPLGHFQLSPIEFLDDEQKQWWNESIANSGDVNDESGGLEIEPFQIPAALPFPGNPSLVVKSDGSSRRQADELLKLAMLRMLASFPAGKLRFTVIDPISLGENFAGFMHLTDYDEQLIGSRIWTESSQIEKRLTLLTEHMENVFQSYLRNEFSTIQEYNEHAGEVAEPYQVLVVAGFPTNFTEPAMRRIHSIATSGERCGVYLLMSVDDRLKLPQGLDLEDIEAHATVLQFRKKRLVWSEPFLRKLKLETDSLPDGDVLSSIVRRVGQHSKHTRRVEVAFDRVSPRSDALWKASSRNGIEIPLGRAGATKLQHLSLGHGTSQHVLIAGKTGSGKTTFLHTLITNVALHYSPLEAEFYLIDFKKGVEFKTYASSGLPHARVIAIESDREFGLSVLERLDGILKERGDQFREAGVPDLPAFRDKFPDRPLPRILLIVDEFQEFFVEDDRIGQNASLFLDRLVRQGRAFGIHVLLGSQTLSGAYSLARSTLGQVAVRIALQCSETDAHLILSEENTAARLLSRPGEAIYNDANGLVEGNHPFQIAYLPDSQRDQFLGRIGDLQNAENHPIAQPVVFEGHLPAELSQNLHLSSAIDSQPAETPLRIPIWLGDAVSIKDPTSVNLFAAAGRNILICGSNENAAAGVTESIALSLSAHLPRLVPDTEPVSFVVLDGAEPGTAGLENVFETLPQTCLYCRPGEEESAIDDLYQDLQSRLEGPAGEERKPPRFLFVASVGRFRELRKGDDDFGFGGFDSKPEMTVAQKFSEIIKSGPSMGIHTILWSDSYSNLNRWMSPSAMRDFEARIGFQMNSSDSSQLFDSPVAGQLGPNRGVVFLVDEGRIERFRPYRPADAEWRAQVAARLAGADPDELESLSDIDEWTVI